MDIKILTEDFDVHFENYDMGLIFDKPWGFLRAYQKWDPCHDGSNNRVNVSRTQLKKFPVRRLPVMYKDLQ